MLASMELNETNLVRNNTSKNTPEQQSSPR